MRELRLTIRDEHQVKKVVQRGSYTYVEIEFGVYKGCGFSKWNPNDKGRRGWDYSKELGVLKATNKAIDDVVRQMHISFMRPPEKTLNYTATFPDLLGLA